MQEVSRLCKSIDDHSNGIMHFGGFWKTNDEVHRDFFPFAKIHFLIHRKLNAFLCSCQWTITHTYAHVYNHVQYITTHHINTWAETYKSIFVHIKIGFSYKSNIYIVYQFVYCDSYLALIPICNTPLYYLLKMFKNTVTLNINTNFKNLAQSNKNFLTEK